MYDDDQTPADPFVIDSIVAKANDRRIFMHADFEAICSKYWQLLRTQPETDRTSDTISKDQYVQLIKRMYKVLLPLYREDEMAREVAQEWIQDARGKSTMNLTKFQKMLYRIAHSWGTHIDMDEYSELLEKIYARITIKQVIRGDSGKVETILPRIQIDIFQEQEEEDGAEWQSCVSDEYQDESYEYQTREDPNEPAVTKRYKRPLPDGMNEDDGGVMMSTRDPFYFKEEVQFYMPPSEGDVENQVKGPSDKDIEVDLIAEITDVYPMGYPAEQFICQLKNNVIAAFIKLKEDRRKAVAEMRRQMYEDGTRMKVERPPEIQRDPGLLDAQGFQHEEFFTMVDTKNEVRIPTLLRVQDRNYNQMRQLFKDTNEISLRPWFNNPNKQVLKGQIASKMLGSNDPATQVNENLYNPALERRLLYKQIMCEMGESVKNYCLNTNYLFDDPVYATAFRSDVNRIETSGKMSIKPNVDGELAQPYEFCPVTTSYQKTMMVMLSYKFQAFWTQKVSEKQSPDEKARDEKTYETEKTRKTASLFKDNLVSKNLTENFDEKNYLKLMRGPFYSLISREGSREDNFVSCTTHDLIDSANAELMKILVLGKPRSGKTTLAEAVSKKLDLVRISTDLWLNDLFDRIKDREENPPEEEEEPEEEAAVEEEPPAEEEGEPELDADGNPIEKPKPEVVIEEPKEPEEPKREKKDMWLTELEYTVRNKMRAGDSLTEQDIDDIIIEMINSPTAQTKGFIIDLNFHSKNEVENWGVRLMERDILSEQNELTHIIELLADDDEVKRRSRNILITPANGKPYSAWERKERNKPKPVKIDPETGEPMEEEEEEPEENEEELLAMGLKGPLLEKEMVKRCCDEPINFAEELDYYTMRERNIFDELIVKLFDSTYVKLDIAGLNPTEVCDSVLARVKPNQAVPLRPIAHIIEDGAGAFKDLLTAGLGEDDDVFFLPRQWSLWKTYDPVSLHKGQVEQGAPEFAAHFGNNVFVFQNEENLKAFVKEPRAYIGSAPEMPPNFRLSVTGPRGIGVHTQTERLEQLYGWRVVDFKQIVQEKLRDILGMSSKLPNNITDEGPCMVCLSEAELADIKEGKPFPSWKFLPWIMEFLGIPLRVNDPPPPEEDSETDKEWDEERLKQHTNKKKTKAKAAAANAKAAQEAEASKADRANRRKEALEQGLNLEELGLQESEEEIIIDDVSIERLILQENEDGSKPIVDRFILIGFPQTETHCQKLADFNIKFDRVVVLSEEDNEEEPGKDITKRMTEKDEVAYDFAAELEISNAQLAVIKEWLGEDAQDRVLELRECSGSIEEVSFKIRSKLDPFFTRPDDTTDDIRTTADYEDDMHRLPRSDFGDYCPVTFVDEGYLVKGGADEEGGDPNELYVNGKRYYFAGSKELEKFRKQPSKYMIVQSQGQTLPIPPPAPKFMLTGSKCAGVTTQINMLCEKFKLESLELMDTFNKKQAEQLKSRQRKRLLERGFKGMPEQDDPDAPPEIDEEIVNDPEDFEKNDQDVKDIRDVINTNKGIILDGNWHAPIKDDFGFEEEGEAQEAVEVEYVLPDLLKQARRMPEIVVILRCKEDAAIKRNFEDDEEKLKAMLEEELAKREKKRVDEREKGRQEKMQELADQDWEEMQPAEIQEKKAEAMKEWEDAKDEEEREAEEADDNKPDLSKMREARAEKIKEAIGKDEENLESLKTKLTEEWSAVQVLELDTSKISAEFVHIKLLDMLKMHIKYRKDLIERAQAIKIKPAEVKVYEASYTYQQSKLGVNSPISPFNPKKVKDHAVLYRERIYYLADADEQDNFLLEPSRYTNGVEAVPQDLRVLPRVVVQGLPKSGKSTVCAKIAEVTGAVHLQMEELIEGFVDRDSSFAEKVAEKLRNQGRDLDDLMLVQLIQKRVEMADCAANGWVLENFPQTRSQAILMAKKSLNPCNVIYTSMPIEEVYKRTAPLQNEEFSCNRVILGRRLKYAQSNLPGTIYFFQKFYNCVTTIDAMKSKWFIEHVAVQAISKNLQARMSFARDFQHEDTAGSERACRIENLHMDRVFFKQSISQFGHYCPVSWRNQKKFVQATHEPELAVLYKNLFYYFANDKQREIFMVNPKQFTENVIFSSERNVPKRMSVFKASEIADTEKALLNYCVVTLADEEKLVAGNPILVAIFKGEKYSFANEEKLCKFLLQPQRYAKTKLPVKIPPEQKPILLYNLQKEENSITFLEQALGSVVTKGLREIGEQRLKYPTLSVKETMLKLFAIFLKTENPANTAHMKEKYMKKMQCFLEKCTVPEELHDLADEKKEKKQKAKWPQFKEEYYNRLGTQYDKILHDVEKEKQEGFWNYMK